MRFVIAFVVVFACSVNGIAQRLTIDLESFPTLTQDYGKSIIAPYSGIGLTYFYDKYATGLNYRSVPWGSEVSVSQAFNIPFYQSEKIAVGSSSQVYVGVPLYYNKFSTSLGASSRVTLKFEKFQRIFISGGLGYHISPSYRSISSKYQFVEGILAFHIALLK
ncbi:hypothetical protein [Portibacter lacus]|uniref:Uncharacterized protein n=1 Tax=Portibacter lacus TaxID=1099794 RepID=A0AA37WCC9_9BACT|nr:hypothetical protein [Portibacter lacus]GLR15943.1 hypothetical protein GCM10007940_05580 [Portibacter lacus]